MHFCYFVLVFKNICVNCMSLHLLGLTPVPKADDAPPSAAGFFLAGVKGSTKVIQRINFSFIYT
jgi:hypothetical protein